MRAPARRGLFGQGQLQLPQQQFPVGRRLRIAAEDQSAAGGRREMHAAHWPRAQVFQSAAGAPSRRPPARFPPQTHLPAAGQETHGKVRPAPGFGLMLNRPHGQIAFGVLERFLHLAQLQVKLPGLGGVFFGQIGAQEITARAPAPLAEFLFA